MAWMRLFLPLFFALFAITGLAQAGSASADAAPSEGAFSADDSASTSTQDLLLYALSLNGTRYKFGGRSADAGFDCSGFVGHVFQKTAGLLLPSTAQGISKDGRQISKAQLRPGDLVFFNTLRRAFSHVGIYLGDNRFIHASSSASGDVMISDMSQAYWASRFNGARRLAISN